MIGRCSCGKTQYELHDSPLYVHCCHCLWCQRESGSAFAINILIESRRVTLDKGKVTKVPLPSESGNGQTMTRCADCLVTLWSHYAGMGDKIAFVRAGTLDNPGDVSPDIHIYTESKQEWVVLPSNVPNTPGYYRRSQMWPDASLARWETLKSGGG